MEGEKKIAIMAVPNPRAYSLTAEQLKELEASKPDMSRIEKNARLVRKLNVKGESGLTECEPEM